MCCLFREVNDAVSLFIVLCVLARKPTSGKFQKKKKRNYHEKVDIIICLPIYGVHYLPCL